VKDGWWLDIHTVGLELPNVHTHSMFVTNVLVVVTDLVIVVFVLKLGHRIAGVKQLEEWVALSATIPSHTIIVCLQPNHILIKVEFPLHRCKSSLLLLSIVT
jgi:hypothetical protein